MSVALPHHGMYRLEVFVSTIYEAPAGAQAPCSPLQPLENRGFLFKVDGKPVVPLALAGAEVSYAPEAGPNNTVRFEALISARASGSWLLGPADQAQGGGSFSPEKQQQRVLHVLYTASRPNKSGETLCGSGSCLPTVLGVGRLPLPVLDARKCAAGIVQQAQQGWSDCLAEAGGLEPLACPPIQFEALQQCRLSCPNSGVDVGRVSLAARLSIVEEPATHCISGSCSKAVRPVQQQPAVHPAQPPQASYQRQAAPSPEKLAQRHAGTQASPSKHKASAPAAAQQGQLPYAWPAMPLPYPSVPMVPAMGLPPMWGLPAAAMPLWQCNLPAPYFPVTPWGLSTSATGAAPAASEGPWGPVRPEPVSPQPVEVKLQATGAQLGLERPPSRHACTQTADENVVERKCLRLRKACSNESPRQGIKDSMMPREHLKSPLKPQPTPLVLEHHLEAVPRSRSPSQRHRAMVKSALHESGAFYCPGCLKRFMQLPQSPSRAQVQEAMASCGCKDCSTQLRCGSPPAAVSTVAGLGNGALGGWEGERANSSCGCHGCGSPTAAAQRKSSPGRGQRSGSPARFHSSSRPGTQLQQRQQLDGAGQVAAAAVEAGTVRQKGAIAAASAYLSGGGPQVQLAPEAAALQQLLTSLNLSSDWQAKLLGPLAAAAAAAAASQHPPVSYMVAPATVDSIAAVTSRSVATMQSPINGGCKAQPPLSQQGRPAERNCREEASQSSLGESSFASQSSAAGSRAGTPRRHWVPAGAGGTSSRTGSPAATPRHKAHSTKSTSCGEGSQQKVCPESSPGSSAGVRGRRESPFADNPALAVVQPTCESSAASSREGRGGPPTVKQRKPGDGQSLQGPYRAPPRKADTMQDIISRNQQLLQLTKPGSASGGGCHSDDSQPNSPRQDCQDGASLPIATFGTARQQGSTDVHTRTNSPLLERAPPHKCQPLPAVSGQPPSPLAERLGSFKVTIDGTSVVCTKRSSGNTSGEDSSGCQSARETQDASALGQPTISSLPAQKQPPVRQSQLASSSSGGEGGGESAEDIIARLACYRSGSSGEEPVEPFSMSATDSEIAEPAPGWATGLHRMGASGGARAAGQIGAAAVLAGSSLGAKADGNGDAEALSSSGVEVATESEVYEDDFEAGSDADF